MAQRTADEFLAGILNCGYADIPFILELEDKFDVDLDFEQIRSNYGKLDANTIIYEIYSLALNNADFDFDLHSDKCEIFTNCLDSSLTINGESCYDIDDIKTEIAKLSDSI